MDIHIHTSDSIFFVYILKTGENLLLRLLTKTICLQKRKDFLISIGNPYKRSRKGIIYRDDRILGLFLAGILHPWAVRFKVLWQNIGRHISAKPKPVLEFGGNVREIPSDQHRLRMPPEQAGLPRPASHICVYIVLRLGGNYYISCHLERFYLLYGDFRIGGVTDGQILVDQSV